MKLKRFFVTLLTMMLLVNSTTAMAATLPVKERQVGSVIIPEIIISDSDLAKCEQFDFYLHPNKDYLLTYETTEDGWEITKVVPSTSNVEVKNWTEENEVPSKLRKLV